MQRLGLPLTQHFDFSMSAFIQLLVTNHELLSGINRPAVYAAEDVADAQAHSRVHAAELDVFHLKSAVGVGGKQALREHFHLGIQEAPRRRAANTVGWTFRARR